MGCKAVGGLAYSGVSDEIIEVHINMWHDLISIELLSDERR